jgi:hypothetical protein
MNLKLNSLGVYLLLAYVPACGDDKPQDETTMQTDPGTTGPGTMTESSATESSPTEGTATESSPTEGTDSGTSDDTTGGTSDPEILQQCLDSFANGDVLLMAQCQCQVDLGVYPDVATCLAEQGEEAPSDECVCEVYSQFPATKEGLDCVAPAQAMVAMCAPGVMCVEDPQPLFECLDPYYMALDECPDPPKQALAQVEIQCNDIPPYTCKSGEDIPETWKCNFEADCMDASDEMGCPGSFMCADGMGYVPEEYKCDGYPDCADASDEAGCPTFMCMNGETIPEQFKCNGDQNCEDGSDEGSMAGCPVYMCMNGMEIPETWKCDGFPDCEDESDEGMMAMCPVFMCMSGEEIPESFHCNGFPDCMDESDEVDCPMFMCGSGETVPLSFKCDGEADCEDGSDEADCP